MDGAKTATRCVSCSGYRQTWVQKVEECETRVDKLWRWKFDGFTIWFRT